MVKLFKGYYYILILIIFLFLTSCNERSNPNSGYQQSNEVKTYGTNYIYDLFDLVVDDRGNFYIADKDRIIVLDNKFREEMTITDNFSFISSICIDGMNIYAFDAKDHMLKEYNSKGKYINEYQLADISAILSMVKKDNTIIMHTQSYKGSLAVYNITNNEIRFYNQGNIKKITNYNGDCITMCFSDAATGHDIIKIFNIKEDMIIDQYEIDRTVRDYYADTDNNKIYYLSSGNVYCYSTADHISNTIFMSDKEGISRILMYKNNGFLFDRLEQQVYKIEKAQVTYFFRNSETVQLVSNEPSRIKILTQYDVRLFEDKTKSMIEVFLQKYPNCNVIIESIPSVREFNYKMETQLLAGESAIDIYVLNSEDIMKHKALEDMSLYTLITQRAEKFFQGLINNCTIDGRLIGIPISYEIFAWELNEGLLEKMGLQAPKMIWTWDEFYTFAKDARRDINGDGIKDTYALCYPQAGWFNVASTQYLSRYFDPIKKLANFDDLEYVNLLNLEKKIMQEDLVLLISTSQIDEKMMQTISEKVLFKPNMMTMWEGDTHIVLPPTLGSKTTYSSQNFKMLSINSHSNNKSIAADYISEYISIKNLLYSKATSFYRELDDYNNIILPDNSKLSTKKNRDIYNILINYSIPDLYRLNTGDFVKYYYQVLEKFHQGFLTAEDTAKMVDAKASMIVGE